MSKNSVQVTLNIDNQVFDQLNASLSTQLASFGKITVSLRALFKFVHLGTTYVLFNFSLKRSMRDWFELHPEINKILRYLSLLKNKDKTQILF